MLEEAKHFTLSSGSLPEDEQPEKILATTQESVDSGLPPSICTPNGDGSNSSPSDEGVQMEKHSEEDSSISQQRCVQQFKNKLQYIMSKEQCSDLTVCSFNLWKYARNI